MGVNSLLLMLDKSPSVVTDGLIVYLDAGNTASYPGTGSLWYDISGNSNNATLYNTPTLDTGKQGNLRFNGTNQYLNILGNSATLSVMRSYSIEFWIKTTYSGNRVICEKGANQKMFFQPGNTADDLYFADYPFNTISTKYADIYNNNWNHIVLVTGSGFNIIYFNGTILNQMGLGFGAANSSNINIMGRGGVFCQPGNLGLIRIYNRSLSAEEVLQNYNISKSRFV